MYGEMMIKEDLFIIAYFDGVLHDSFYNTIKLFEFL